MTKQENGSISTYGQLQDIDVSKAVTKKTIKSKKPGVNPFTLSYLSWVDAYHTIMSLYPNARFVTSNFPYILNGVVVEGFEVPYLKTHEGVFVEVRIDLRDANQTTKTCQLPVMDHRYEALKSPDARQISDATQRCLAKCAALHGFGIQLYSKEDLKDIGNDPENGDDKGKDPSHSKKAEPSKPTPEQGRGKISEKQRRLIYVKMKAAGVDADQFKHYLFDKYNIESSTDLPYTAMDEVLSAIEQWNSEEPANTPPKAENTPTGATGSTITSGMVRIIQARAISNDIDNESLEYILKKEFGINSLEEIPLSKKDEIMQRLSAGNVPMDQKDQNEENDIPF